MKYAAFGGRLNKTMGDLDHKQIVLGLSGGIAGYKSAELLRRLQDEGVMIDVVMTQSATRFITPVTFQALSGRPTRGTTACPTIWRTLI